jgi:hypothetical protein
LVAWKIEEVPYGNDKTIESDINTIPIIVIGHCVANFLNLRAHSEYFLCRTSLPYITSITYAP